METSNDKVNIVNFLLTRRCNLRCEFCGIVKDDPDKPKEYPLVKHYMDHELKTSDVLEFLRKLKIHNPNSFVIWYGGEPFLRKDLSTIIDYCNKENINYTIISNNTEAVQDKIENLIKEVGYIQGFTASVDPSIFSVGTPISSDRDQKSKIGFDSLLKYKDHINDVVAEITVTSKDIEYLYPLVKSLSDNGINSDITFVDIKKSGYYDFSCISDDDILVRKSSRVREIFNRIIDEKLNVHMRDTLLPIIYDILPSELDCKLEDNVHNICVDADGTIRLCLRIKGFQTPENFNVENCFEEDGSLNEMLKHFIGEDKRRLCLKCNHTCYIMSQINNVNDLVHKEVRNK